MLDEVIHVIETISMLLLVILSGVFVRKIRLLDRRTTETLSRFVVDVAFPALVFTSMLRTVDAQTLADEWHLPVIGFVTIVLGIGIGYLTLPILMRHWKESHPGSIAFAIGTPNWLFIPLPIAIALYGDNGERAVLLCNVGALLAFWSVGVWAVKGGRLDVATVRKLTGNPGLLATLLGIVAALLFPWARTLEEINIADASLQLAISSVVIQAISFIGEVTVPLSMVVTGALLADAGAKNAWNRHVFAISAIRLAAFPAFVVLILWLAEMVGVGMAPYVSTIVIIIAAMPVAVTCSVVVEKYEGDELLVSRAIFVSTLASVVTVPVIVWFGRAIGL